MSLRRPHAMVDQITCSTSTQQLQSIRRTYHLTVKGGRSQHIFSQSPFLLTFYWLLWYVTPSSAELVFCLHTLHLSFSTSRLLGTTCREWESECESLEERKGHSLKMAKCTRIAIAIAMHHLDSKWVSSLSRTVEVKLSFFCSVSFVVFIEFQWAHKVLQLEMQCIISFNVNLALKMWDMVITSFPTL